MPKGDGRGRTEGRYGKPFVHHTVGSKNLSSCNAFLYNFAFLNKPFPEQGPLPMSDPQDTNRGRRNLVILTAAAGGAAAVTGAIPLVASMLPSDKARALGAP